MSTTSNIEEKLKAYFDRLKKQQRKRKIKKKMHVYKIDPNEVHSDPTLSAFSPTDSYWMKDVQHVRFDDCDSRGILYRPKIVKEMMTMVDNAFNKNYRTGIMIIGPHGIGKSHSLVNLVRKLQYDSSCKYLVTFIPDCDRWEGVSDLYNAICSSFGTSVSALDWPMRPDLNRNRFKLDTFVNAIDLILRGMDKKWVLVFDQINRLFSRPMHKGARDLGSLPFPFSAMIDIHKGGRIVSIVSASTDNYFDVYKERHRGFEQYKHPCNMNLKEICAAFEEVDIRNDSEEILEVTGGVPLQVRNLISFKFSIDDYEGHELSSILCSLKKLRDEEQKKGFDRIAQSAFCSVLSEAKDGEFFEKKYSFVDEGEEAYKLKPLYPLVLVGYRIFLQKDIKK